MITFVRLIVKWRISVLPVKEVIQKLVDAKLRNVLIVADACRAGDQNDFGSDLYDLAKKANIAVLLGCEPGKKSYEVPQFQSGAFTYFLLKALGNPKIRTDSGGLWTSRIALNVENSVYEYTKHDYGDNAQRPKSFADPTSDVMLAKFVNRPDPSKSLEKDEDMAMVTDPAKNSDMMRVIGESLLMKNDFIGALEATKQALSLDSENLFAAYYATISTSYLGRSGEHEKYCNLLKNSTDPYFRNLGYVQSDSRATPISERIKALQDFWESSPKDELHALLVWGKARTYLPLMLTKVLIQKMLPSIKQETRLKAFFEGEVAVAEGRLEDGLGKYQAALKLSDFTQYLTDDELTVLQFPLFRQLGRDEELKSLLRKQFDKEQVAPMIWVTAAANLKEMGNRDAALAIIRKGIKEPNLTEQQVVLCGIIMGVNIVDILDDLEAQVKLTPYSWKIRTIALIARGIKDRDAKATERAFEQAERYCDDELEIISLTFSLENTIFDEAVKYKGAKAEDFSEAKELSRLLFFNRADHIGTDSEKWYQLGELGLTSLQGPATLRLFKQYLKDFNANSELGSEFYTMLFSLAACVEDDAIVKFAVNHPALAEPDRSDIKLDYAAYLIARGDYVNAKIAREMVNKVSPANEIVKQSLDAIFKARSGDLPSLNKFLGQEFPNTEGNLVAEGIAALALSDLGKNDDAMQHLARFIDVQPTMVASVATRCAERYMKLLKSKSKVSEADEALFSLLRIDQSSPGIMASYFGAKPGIENFVGILKADTKWVSDQTYDGHIASHKDEYQTCAIGGGHFELTVEKDGTAKGFIQVLDGERFDLNCMVDQFGNLRGKAINKVHSFDVEAKMIGNDFKKKESFKKSSIGQMVQVFDGRGLVTHWMLPAGVLTP
jgi:tetratricopeptide (TPR) repeat protein